jgi:hypothetical protein
VGNFTFGGQLRMSEGHANGLDATTILAAEIPGAVSVRRASTADDKAGTDYWVRLCNGTELSVDLKARSVDFAAKPPPHGGDDLALEVWSVRDPPRVGWTLDTRKRTDYVLWHWQDTGRWCLLPYRMLLAVFTLHLAEWSGRYKHDVQTTRTATNEWQSECVFVPRREVWKAIYRRFSGNVTQPPAPVSPPQPTSTVPAEDERNWVTTADYDDAPTDDDLRREAERRAP